MPYFADKCNQTLFKSIDNNNLLIYSDIYVRDITRPSRKSRSNAFNTFVACY